MLKRSCKGLGYHPEEEKSRGNKLFWMSQGINRVPVMPLAPWVD